MSSVTELFKTILTIPPPFNMVVMVVLIVFTAGIFTSLFKQIRKYACHRQEVELKRELVERGLSVDEIERILAAGGTSASKDSGGCG
jgi:hypothetical protein